MRPEPTSERAVFSSLVFLMWWRRKPRRVVVEVVAVAVMVAVAVVALVLVVMVAVVEVVVVVVVSELDGAWTVLRATGENIGWPKIGYIWLVQSWSVVSAALSQPAIAALKWYPALSQA